MQHRHIDFPESQWTVAAIDSILERGGASDIFALLAELKRDPFGPSADAALRAIQHSSVYGYPTFIKAALSRWRGEQIA